MKKRINTIDGKILVQGGTDNELKSNEIRVNADKSLTERVNGEIVNVGGGSGGGLRPVTADDVTLELEDGMSGQTTPIPFATSIFLEQRQNLIVKYEKEIFVGTRSIFVKDDALNSNRLKYYNTSASQEVKLDLYTKD